ncbi:MAG: aminotransferase class V-fold PLP-dependent enzyme, partial [Pseudomonadota bacterium]
MSAYLDHNATSPAPEAVIDAVASAMRVVGNASAQHAHGRAAAKLVSDAREAVGMAMGQCAQDVTFTGSGTEAINTAIHSAVAAGCKRLLVSSLDHPASIMAAEASGATVTMLPATPSGQTDMDALEAILSDWDAAEGRPFLSLVAANSETGVIQDTDRAIDFVHDAGGLVLIDAV